MKKALRQLVALQTYTRISYLRSLRREVYTSVSCMGCFIYEIMMMPVVFQRLNDEDIHGLKVLTLVGEAFEITIIESSYIE